MRQTVGDMVRSMGLVLALIAVILLVTLRPQPDAVKVVDPTQVLLQPNLSTAAMLGFIWFGIAWAAGLRWTHLGTPAYISDANTQRNCSSCSRRRAKKLASHTTLLVLFGIVMIRSSAAGSPSLEGLAARQAQYALAGAVVVVECQEVVWVVWAEWAEWAEWECNSILSSKLSRINSKPRTKIRGFFLTILKNLKTYFSQFFWKQKYRQSFLT